MKTYGSFLLAFDEFYVIIPDTEHYFQGLSVAPPQVDDYWHKLIPQAIILAIAKVSEQMGPTVTTISLAWYLGNRH